MDATHTLGFDKQTHPKSIIIQEEHGVDGGFFLHHLISWASKQGHGICLVLLHHSFGHYHNTGVRMGHNLMQMRENKKMVAIEGLKLAMDLPDIVPSELLQMVKDATSQLTHNGSDKICIIVDDLSDLLLLGFTPGDILAFDCACSSILSCKEGFKVALVHCDNDDEELTHLANLIGHSADVVSRVIPLRTGSCRDVSGCFWVTALHGDKKTWHYKVTDKGAKVFAPGMAEGLM